MVKFNNRNNREISYFYILNILYHILHFNRLKNKYKNLNIKN
jgi:hypothetical protein